MKFVNVVFTLQTETCGEVNLHVPRVLNFFRQVIQRKDMDKDSALLLNAGAHYIKVLKEFDYRCQHNYLSHLLLKDSTYDNE